MTVQVVRKSDQSQLNLSGDDAARLLKACKAPNDVALGSPKNGRPHLLLTVRFKDRTFTWVQGDTHAIWASHQSDEMGRRVFDALWDRLEIGDAVSIEVLKVEFVPAGKGKVKSLNDLNLDL